MSTVQWFVSPFFYFLFLLKNIPTTSFTSHQRERERAGSDRQKDKGDAPAPFVHAALPNLIGVHHVALPHLLPHRHSSSSPPLDWVRSACSSYLFIYFHICLFWFNFIVRIGFCFVWIMWDVFWEWSKETETKIRRFLIPAIVFLFLLFFCVFFFF